MEQWVVSQEPLLRLAVFGIMFLSVAAAELVWPRRRLSASKWKRWTGNLGVLALNGGLMRLIVPLSAVGAALWAESRGFGLLNWLDPALPVQALVTVVALDLVIYAQHVAFHRSPVLWRLHRVHHIDTDIDVTTGGRFHPFEIALSALIKIAAVLALGAPAFAVILFEVILNATSTFNHGNVKLASWLDRALRLVVVTPDMHRVHHSVLRAETDSNFGFNLPWWDRLFGTYRQAPREGHEGMTIGLPDFREAKWLGLPWLLAAPFLPSSRGEARSR